MSDKVDQKGPHLLDTDQFTLHGYASGECADGNADGDPNGGGAHQKVVKLHHLVSENHMADLDIPVNPSENYVSPEHLRMNNKKIGDRWAGYDGSNVKAGCHFVSTTLDPTQSHWLITEHGKNDTKSAMWHLIDLQKDTGSLYEGAFHKNKLDKMNYEHEGQKAIKMNKDQYTKCVNVLA